MVEVVRPAVGERIYDPCFGTAGFLAEAGEYIRRTAGALSGAALEKLKRESFFGIELKPLTYLFGLMNMLLHRIEGANLELGNALERHAQHVPERNRYDVILSNPPYGGKLAGELQTNFTIRSGATEILFLQHIMANLAVGGRAAVIIPEGVLFRGGPDAKVRERLLQDFDVHTILSLPAGCFLPLHRREDQRAVLRPPRGRAGHRERLVLRAGQRRLRAEADPPARRGQPDPGFPRSMGRAGVRWAFVDRSGGGDREEGMRSFGAQSEPAAATTNTGRRWNSCSRSRRRRSGLSSCWGSWRRSWKVGHEFPYSGSRRRCRTRRRRDSISRKTRVFRWERAMGHSHGPSPIGTVRVLGSVSENITEAGLRNSSATLVPPGSVLFSTRASIGKIAIADRECATNQGFCNFVPKRGVLDPWYLAYYLSAETDNISALAGKTTFREVSRKKLRSFSIPVPPLEEQRRIVSCISECMERIDEIRTLRAQISLATAALLPSSLASTFVNLKAEYPSVAIGECLVESRYGTSRRCDAPSTATPVLRIPNVSRERLSFDDLKYCELDDIELDRLLLRNGDILVVRTNGSPNIVGRCAVYVEGGRPFAFASYLIRLRIDLDKADPNFLAFFLTSTMGRDAIAGIRRTSAGQYNVNSENLREIKVPLPPLSIQKETTERLTEQRAVVRTIEECQTIRAAEADPLMSAVLRKAFAGDL